MASYHTVWLVMCRHLGYTYHAEFLVVYTSNLVHVVRSICMMSLNFTVNTYTVLLSIGYYLSMLVWSNLALFGRAQ